MENSSTDFGYSYFLGWLAVVAAFVATVICLCTAFSMGRYEDEMEDEKHGLPVEQSPYYRSGSDMGPPAGTEYGAYPYDYDYGSYMY